MSEPTAHPTPAAEKNSAAAAPTHQIARWKMVLISLVGGTVALGAMLSVGMILKVHFSGDRHVAETHEEEHHPTEAEQHRHDFSHSYELRKMSIALSDSHGDGGAFAQFTLVLDCPSEESKRALEVSRSLVRDAVYEAAADFRVEHFDNTDGYNMFRERILEVLQARLGEKAPKGAALEDFVLTPTS